MSNPLHTNVIKLTRETRAILSAAIIDVTAEGCHILDPKCRGTIQIEHYGNLNGDKGRASATRVAWALANPTACLTETEVTRHLCEHVGPPHSSTREGNNDWSIPLCVNPEHLAKTGIGDTKRGERP